MNSSFRRMTVAGALVCLAAMTMVGATQVITWGLDSGLGRYPDSTRPASAALRFPTFHNGEVRQDSTFATPDESGKVVAWYARRYKLEPGADMFSYGECVAMHRFDVVYVFRHTVALTVCGSMHGTRVFLSQTFALQPPSRSGHG